MDKRLFIGMLSARFYPCQGGAEIQCRLLSKQLKQSGHSVVILTQKLPRTTDYELIDNFAVFRLGLPISGALGSFTYFLSSIKTILKKFNDVDILHAHIAATPAITASLFTKFFRKPSVIKFAGSRDTGDIAVSLRTAHGKFKLDFIKNNASAFVCPSSEISKELEGYGFQKEKIRMIPNGIDTKAFAPADPSEKYDLKRSTGLPQEGKIVIYCGRIEQGKGIEDLIDAWSALERAADGPLPFLVILGSGRLAAALKERASALKRVIFTGWKDNTSDYLRASDVFVLPSRGEGMPNSLLEAMSCGLPCISTDIGGIKELIQHNVNGLLFEPGDTQTLLKCVQTLTLDEPLRVKIGVAARETIEDRYTIDIIAAKYVSLYRDIISKASKTAHS